MLRKLADDSSNQLFSSFPDHWRTKLYDMPTHQLSHVSNVKDAQLSQRDRAAGCVIVFAKSRRLEVGDNILRTL